MIDNSRDPILDHLTEPSGSTGFSIEEAERSTETVPSSNPLNREKRRRSKSARSGFVAFLSFLITMALVGGVGLLGAIWYSQTTFDAPGPLTEATTYEVPKGASFSSIIPDLEARNIIPRQGVLRVFLNGIRSAGKSSGLKAGEFAFEPGMSMRQVMLQLTEGRALAYSITIPEGWTSYRVMERVQFAEHLTGELPPIPAEGTLLPDTYSYTRGTSRADLVKRMQKAQSDMLARVWAARDPDLPLKSPEELVILASIVEKETGVGSERPHVASVFVNRLRKGMLLQTDPTVIYGIWGGQGKPKDRGGLRRSELDRPTPYNTYKIKGLPPTPIANPGRAAMEAVAKPLETGDLFFVADGTGGHVFARTLAEHNANVVEWRKIEAKRKKERKEAQDKGLRTDTSN